MHEAKECAPHPCHATHPHPPATALTTATDTPTPGHPRPHAGCTHFIIGRDMAGCKSSLTGEDFYGPYDAQEFAKAHAAELGMQTVPSLNVVYTEVRRRCGACAQGGVGGGAGFLLLL